MYCLRAAAFSRSLLAVTLVLCAPFAAPALANTDPDDEQSLSNGAQLYEVFCSECHGSDAAHRYGQLYAPDETATVDEYRRMLEIVQQEESAQLIVVPEEDDPWPEWAERPDPNADEPPDEKTEVMNTMTAVIDEVYGIEPESSSGANAAAARNGELDAQFQAQLTENRRDDAGPAGGFEPVPGATNLADPASYFYGTSEEEIFDSIANGTGEAMPGWRTELGGDEAIWDVVNYIRSFWGEEWLY